MVAKNILKKYNFTKELVIPLEDFRKSKQFDSDGERKRKFTCYVCLEKFLSARDLSKHKALHDSSDFDNEEETQNKPKPKETSRTIDVDKLPISKTSYKCLYCNVFFESSDDAKRHKTTTKCKFFCQICTRTFNTLYAFVVHLLQHKSNSARSRSPVRLVYTCQTCAKVFDNCLLLRIHEISHHNPTGDNRPPVPENNVQPTETQQQIELCCDICYDVFESLEEQKSHMEFHELLAGERTETITINDDDEVVVIEEKKTPVEIITTIKSKAKPRQKKMGKTVVQQQNTALSTASLEINNTVSTSDPIASHETNNMLFERRNVALPALASQDTVRMLPQQQNIAVSTSLPIASQETNKMLSERIKKMLDPKTDSKSVFLPRPPPICTVKEVPPLAPCKPRSSDLQLCKTGPYSFSFCYPSENVPMTTTATKPSAPTTTTNSSANESLPKITTATAQNVNYFIQPGYIQLARRPTTSTTATCAAPSSSNIAYSVVDTYNPMPTIAVDQTGKLLVSSSTPPIVVNNPSQDLAYVIIPHGNPAKEVTAVAAPEPAAQSTSTEDTTTSAVDIKPEIPSFSTDETIVLDSDSSEDNTGKDGTVDAEEFSDTEYELVIDEGASPDKGDDANDPEREKPDGDDEVKYQFPMKCDGCSVVFQRYANMKIHNEKKFRCALCSFGCCKQQDFKQHYLLQHRKHYCNRCSFLADNGKKFTKHNRSQHFCGACNTYFVRLSLHKCPNADKSVTTESEKID